MNTPPSGDDLHEREWQAQERALREERSGMGATNDDMRVLQYRVLARALRQPPADSLPIDFARDTTRRIETAAAEQASAIRVSIEPFERNLLRLLAAAFGLGIGIVIALYANKQVRPAIDAILPIVAVLKNPWLLTFSACLALADVSQRWRKAQ